MVFAAPGAVPPIVVSIAKDASMPESRLLLSARPLPSAVVPSAAVPIRFPCTRLLRPSAVFEAPPIRIPLRPLAEMMFRAPASVPPIVVLEPMVKIPSWPFPSATIPVTSVPM
jgi:hypothetical protein